MGESPSKLEKILEDIRAKTGTEVRTSARGEGETRFTATYSGRETPLYLDGVGADAERAARLVAYLIENSDWKELFPDRRDALKSILLGEGSRWDAFRFLTKYNLSDGACYAVDLMPDRNVKEAAAHVERCLEGGQDLVLEMDDTRLAVVKFSEEAQSSFEYAQFLSQTLYEELGIRASVGVGCEVRSFSEIPLSYNQAATAVRMSGIFHNRGEVHSYREYLLVRMLEDVPKSRLEDYMKQFRIEGAEEILRDEDMADTAEAFLESSLNISETSRNLYMHRNTLMYRLDKIERMTGLNIRKFSDAVTFRVITILYKLLQS